MPAVIALIMLVHTKAHLYQNIARVLNPLKYKISQASIFTLLPQPLKAVWSIYRYISKHLLQHSQAQATQH